MHIHHLEISADGDSNIYGSISNLNILISEIESKNIPEEVCYKINYQIDKVNSFSKEHEVKIKKQLEITVHRILHILKRDLGIIPENYYRNQYLALGMTVFGLPLGALIATLTGNTSYLAFGMLLGIPIGIAIGSKKDQIADKENKVIKINQ